MNLNVNPTVEQLRELIQHCDDSAGHHVLWVNKHGDVNLTKIPKDQTPVGFEKVHPDMQIRFETFQAGNEYVGPEAADDAEWISELFESLNEKWQETQGKSEVAYVGAF